MNEHKLCQEWYCDPKSAQGLDDIYPHCALCGHEWPCADYHARTAKNGGNK